MDTTTYARVASGHVAAAPPSSVMKSRRRITKCHRVPPAEGVLKDSTLIGPCLSRYSNPSQKTKSNRQNFFDSHFLKQGHPETIFEPSGDRGRSKIRISRFPLPRGASPLSG